MKILPTIHFADCDYPFVTHDPESGAVFVGISPPAGVIRNERVTPTGAQGDVIIDIHQDTGEIIGVEVVRYGRAPGHRPEHFSSTLPHTLRDIATSACTAGPQPAAVPKDPERLRPYMESARQIAAQCWCEAGNEGLSMHPMLAGAFATKLAREMADRDEAKGRVLELEDRLNSVIAKNANLREDVGLRDTTIAELQKELESLRCERPVGLIVQFNPDDDSEIKAINGCLQVFAHFLGSEHQEVPRSMREGVARYLMDRFTRMSRG